VRNLVNRVSGRKCGDLSPRPSSSNRPPPSPRSVASSSSEKSSVCDGLPQNNDSSIRSNSTETRLLPGSSAPAWDVEVSHDAVVMGIRDEIWRPSSRAVGNPFPKRPLGCKLSAHAWSALEEMFQMMDADGSNVVTRGDACAFFKGAFAGLSAEAMFHEVAANKSSAITADEFVDFWLQVRTAGYKEKDILAEVETLMEGAAWVGWQDGRHLHQAPAKTFPKRQLFCRLSVQTWKKCQQLFQSMDKHNTQVIAIEEAAEFFKGSFSRVSAVEMFNKMDPCNHGAVTAEEFMNFWIQVKASGYSEKEHLG